MFSGKCVSSVYQVQNVLLDMSPFIILVSSYISYYCLDSIMKSVDTYHVNSSMSASVKLVSGKVIKWDKQSDVIKL